MTIKLVLTSDVHSGASPKTNKIHKEFLSSLSKLDFDVLILAGDLGISKFKHFEDFLKHVREYIPTKPIIAVRGNHDLWDKSLYNLPALIQRGTDKFKEYNIHHLELGPYQVGDISIIGWDGWYGGQYTWQNDWNYIPPFAEGIKTHEWLSRRAYKQFQRVLDELDRVTGKKIVVTHMPMFKHRMIDPTKGGDEGYFDFLKGKFDILCYGHTHMFHNETIDGVRFLNSGSDYDEPKYLEFEV